MTIGERLKDWRTSNSFSMAEISKNTGISTGNIAMLENGRSLPSSKALLALHNEYGLSIDWILTGKEKAPPEKAQLFDDTMKEIINMIYPLCEKQKIEILGMLKYYMTVNQHEYLHKVSN
ncbi:helix-turn-helix domain-containing protein [Anaerotalea alkaliphila]|uniref:Helix-turn-helix transcriptional regulator n=1 Tax=Anaerotalea alkaliphila TaxID=2662126 RepID=A0A7X5HW15_9FIRM|nr:helix-turn-helix transcriptional regulator [Anaerotalea alkaliphila]NDL67695.1 helix-turn-helix transcriptional regulator [Anaerotalea alkaliphila]